MSGLEPNGKVVTKMDIKDSLSAGDSSWSSIDDSSSEESQFTSSSLSEASSRSVDSGLLFVWVFLLAPNFTKLDMASCFLGLRF